MSTAPVSPEPVWAVINGAAAYHSLVAAIDLGIFDALASAGDHGLTAEDLAARAGAFDGERIAVLADLLVSLGLCDAYGSSYLLTPVAARYLVSNSPAQMSDLVRLSPGPAVAWQELAATLRGPGPSTRVIDDPETYLAPLVAATAPTQRAVATAVVAKLSNEGALGPAPLVIDLGAGSAAWSVAILDARAQGRAIAVDLPGVVATTRELSATHADRVEVIEGDYLEVSLPGQADVVVLGHVLRAEPADRARALVLRAIALAGPTGIVIVTDYPRPEPPDADDARRAATLASARHELTLSVTMMASTSGLGITVAQLSQWASEAGFEITERLEPLPRQHVFVMRHAVQSRPH